MFSISLGTIAIPWRNWKQRLCKILHYGQCESCELRSHREKPASIPYVSVQCGFLMKGQCLFLACEQALLFGRAKRVSRPYSQAMFLRISVLNHFGVSYTSLRAIGSRLLCCSLLSWIKGFRAVPSLPRRRFQGSSYFFPPHRGREEIRAPLKTPAWEAKRSLTCSTFTRSLSFPRWEVGRALPVSSNFCRCSLGSALVR